MTEDLISIIMPVYNVEAYIDEAMKSVLQQTYKNFEFIIIDDKSTDKTVEKIKKYKDNRIVSIENWKNGYIDALNYGLEISKGNIIARMDGDDISHPERLEIEYDFLRKNEDISLVGTNLNIIDEEGKIINYKKLPESHKDIEYMMPIIPSIFHATFLGYKKMFLSVGGYTKDYHCEDTTLTLKMLSSGFKMHNIQKPLYNYRYIEKSKNYYDKHYTDYYKFSHIYLRNLFDSNISTIEDYEFRMALLEYYMGDMKIARSYFMKCVKYKDKRLKVLFRYLPISFGGNGLIKFLRKHQISKKFNELLLKYSGIDTYIFKKNSKN